MNQESNNFWLLLAALARRRGMIIGLVVMATLIAVIVSLLLPRWYQATALLLPGEGDNVVLSPSNAAGGLPTISGLVTLPAVVTPADVYARMLRSRTITEPIVDKFDLKTRYHVKTFTDAYLALLSHARFAVTDEGLLSIAVEDRNPDTAAVLTNAFVDQLNQAIGELVVNKARQKRQFLEKRLEQVTRELDSVQAALESFQRGHKAIDLTQQTRLVIEQAVQLKVDLARVDIELTMKAGTFNRNNPEVQQLQRRHDALTRQLQELETGAKDTTFFSVPIAAMPKLQGEYESLYRRVQVDESLHKMLLEQLEQAKVQESEQSPAISVLDRARPPEYRSRPRRTLIVGVTFVLALLMACFLALLFDYIDRLAARSDKETQQALFVIQSFLGWLPGVRRRKPKA